MCSTLFKIDLNGGFSYKEVTIVFNEMGWCDTYSNKSVYAILSINMQDETLAYVQINPNEVSFTLCICICFCIFQRRPKYGNEHRSPPYRRKEIFFFKQNDLQFNVYSDKAPVKFQRIE